MSGSDSFVKRQTENCPNPLIFIYDMLWKREEMRAQGQFAFADEIRQQLETDYGILINDREQTWRKKDEKNKTWPVHVPLHGTFRQCGPTCGDSGNPQDDNKCCFTSGTALVLDEFQEWKNEGTCHFFKSTIYKILKSLWCFQYLGIGFQYLAARY